MSPISLPAFPRQHPQQGKRQSRIGKRGKQRERVCFENHLFSTTPDTQCSLRLLQVGGDVVGPECGVLKPRPGKSPQRIPGYLRTAPAGIWPALPPDLQPSSRHPRRSACCLLFLECPKVVVSAQDFHRFLNLDSCDSQPCAMRILF